MNRLLFALTLLIGGCQTAKLTTPLPAGMSPDSDIYPILNSVGLAKWTDIQVGDFRVTAKNNGWNNISGTSKPVRPGTFRGITGVVNNRLETWRSSRKYQFDATGFGGLPIVVSATEELSAEDAKQLLGRYGSYNLSATSRNYMFGGTVDFSADTTLSPWNFMLYSEWRQGQPANKTLQAGFITDLNDVIIIQSETSRELINPRNGRSYRLPGVVGAMLTGYSFQQNDELIGYLDTVGRVLCLKEGLDSTRKTLLSAVAVALLKRDDDGTSNMGR